MAICQSSIGLSFVFLARILFGFSSDWPCSDIMPRNPIPSVGVRIRSQNDLDDRTEVDDKKDDDDVTKQGGQSTFMQQLLNSPENERGTERQAQDHILRVCSDGRRQSDAGRAGKQKRACRQPGMSHRPG